MPTSPTAEQGSAGWRGRETDEHVDVKHRWQTADTEGRDQRMPGDSRVRGIAVCLLLIAALGFLGWYVRSLLLSPVQTPMLIVSASPYSEPFAPNAWAAEDADRLVALHDKSLTVDRSANLRTLETRLNSLIESQSRAKTVVIVLSMHGSVNDEGRPCLVPPGASPTNAATWTTLESVLQRIKESDIPDSTHKLLVLDCNRVRMRWSQGMLYNAFTNRMVESKVVERAEIPNLVVLNSSSQGQVGWASARLQGTVFGHYFQRGIAGEADQTAEGGNGDRSVSLQELYRYVSHHVDRWARHHRAEQQEPMLIAGPSSADDFHVAWALRGDVPHVATAQPVVADEEIDELWRRHDRLRNGDPYSSNPRLWAEFQRKLLRLEDAATAGSAYADQARSLKAELNLLAGRIADAQPPDGDAANYAFVQPTDDADAESPSPMLHSLPLAAAMGGVDHRNAAAIAATLTSLQNSATEEEVAAALQSLAARPAAGDLADVHFLKLLQRFDVPALWPEDDAPARTIALRRQAELAAVPKDVRTLRWIRPQLDEADVKRRTMEDALFVGRKQAANNPAESIGPIADEYMSTGRTAEDVRQALLLEDRTWAELPWMADWLTRPGTLMKPELQDETVARLVVDLIAESQSLSRALRDGASYDGHANRVQERFDTLAARYDRECNELLEVPDGVDAIALRRVESALSVPLIPGRERHDQRTAATDLRDRLRQKQRKLADELHRAFREVPAGNDDDRAETGDEEARLQRVRDAINRYIARWERHPTVRLLQPDESGDAARTKSGSFAPPPPDATAVQRLMHAERELRMRLDGFPEDLKSAGAASAANPTEFRTAWGAMARFQRAGVAFPLPETQPDPVHHLLRYELHRLLMWHGRRTVDDFWAGAKSGEPPFFAAAARNDVLAANTVFPVRDAEIGKTLEDLIKQRLEAAQRGVRTTAESGLHPSPDEPLTVHAAVQIEQPVPAGVAAFYIGGEAGRLSGSLRSVPLASPREPGREAVQRFNVSLSASDLKHAGQPPDVKPLRAVTLFRGHEFATEFLPHAAGGVVVEYEPQEFAETEISVAGDPGKPLSIVFILDCSQSMSAATQNAAADGTGGSETRMSVAKGALTKMLNQLAKRGNARVGVIFFGHRVGWNAEKAAEILRRKGYARRFPEELIPLEDVETVLPLGRFDETTAGQMERLLKSVEPWGETPLYLSLATALQQFTGEPSAAEKVIVVISDGGNNQLIPKETPLTDAQKAKLITRNQITDELAKQRVPVHLLGFEMTTAEIQQAGDDFQAIKKASGGDYLSAVKAETLLPSLKSVFGADQFRVSDSARRTLHTAEIGESVEVDMRLLSDGAAVVSAGEAAQEVQVEGGEALQLLVGGENGGILSADWLSGDPRFATLVAADGGAESRRQLGIHVPSRSGTGGRDVTFTFSLRQTDRSFARRPAQYWVEVAPLTADGKPAGGVFPFFDRAFAPETPNPVMKLQAANWPANATQAAVRVWILERPVDPTQKIPLSDLLDSGDGSNAPIVGDSRLRAELSQTGKDLRLRIVQRAASDGATLIPLKLDFAAGGPPTPGRGAASPKRIVRRYDARYSAAVHDFLFDASQADAIRSGVLHATARQAVEKPALRLPTPAEIKVPAQGAVLRLPGNSP